MEELDFQGLLNTFRENHFEIGERVILGHFGTVQLLLSLIFDTPVLVHMVSQQYEVDEETGVIVRVVDLMAGDRVVCRATSRIQVLENSPLVVQAVQEGKLGLGQIVVTQQIPNRRILKKVERDETSFSRLYAIVGPSLYFEIHEQFPRQPFVDVGWLKPKSWMPSHFRWLAECKDCTAALEADGYYSMSTMDIWLSSHIEFWGHTKYSLEIKLDKEKGGDNG